VLTLVQGFEQMVSGQASRRDLRDSLALVRRRIRPLEARIVRITGMPELSRRWRQVQQRINTLTDEFGFPRIITLTSADRPAQNGDRRLLAQVDRAAAALDRFLTDGVAGLAATDKGLQFLSDANELRHQLLRFRQQVAANEPAEQLAGRLSEIERATRQLSGRADNSDRVDRGGARLNARGFQQPAQAVAKLRDLLPGRERDRPGR
jgi:hypothetical protein